jgi:hypothetical protein
MNESMIGYKNRLVDNNDKKVKYEFTDEYGNDFLVVFTNDTVGPISKPMLGKSYELTYFVKDTESGDWSVSKVVNTNLRLLLRTILGDILTDFLNDRPWVNTIRLEGLAKDGEVGQTKRTKVYLRYFENNEVEGFKLVQVSLNRMNLIKISR